MPLLDPKGLKNDAWRLVDADAIGDFTHALLGWEQVPAGLPATAVGQRLGLLIPNTLRIDVLMPLLPQLALIAINFPAHGDGRGFSLARQVRDAGFAGTLRACGPLIPDQFAYALACGFDEIDLPEASASRQPAGHWLKAAAAMSLTYQRGYGVRPNILDRRRAARSDFASGQR
jgi:uncharacterized protein (DUF934 family)